MNRNARLRRIRKAKGRSNPKALTWEVRTQVGGRTFFFRACSPEEAVYIRYRVERAFGAGRRRGNSGWAEFCFPHMVDYTSAESGYLTLCGRTFRMKEPWTEEKARGISDGSWFSYCDRPPHCCLVGNKSDPTLVTRVPLKDVVGKIFECCKKK